MQLHITRMHLNTAGYLCEIFQLIKKLGILHKATSTISSKDKATSKTNCTKMQTATCERRSRSTLQVKQHAAAEEPRLLTYGNIIHMHLR